MRTKPSAAVAAVTALAVITVAGSARAQEEAPVQPLPAAAQAQALYAREWISYEGGGGAYRDGWRLSGPAFYEAVDRPDLASRYRKAQTLKSVGTALGGIALGTGVVWGLLDLAATAFVRTVTLLPCAIVDAGQSSSPSSMSSSIDACHQGPDPVPWVVAAVGGTVFAISALAPSDPVSRAQQEALVTEHNRRTALRFHISGGPLPGGEGAMMVATGRF